MAASRTVHVVDDDPSVLHSLGELLVAAGINAVLYDTPFSLLDAAPAFESGCILIDVRMPRMNGLELQRRLTEAGVLLPVIVMTGQGDVPTAVRAMKAGAVDFIEKPFDDHRLLFAVESALAVASRRERDCTVVEAARRVNSLSRREREVLDALVAGRTNKAIARELGLSVRTVEAHRARMLGRLETRTVAEAIRLAVVASLNDRPTRSAAE